MVQKRPFDDDGEQSNVSHKQPRQLEANSHLFSSLEFPCAAVVSSGDGEYAELQVCPKKKDASEKAPISLPCSSWATCSTREETVRMEAPFHVLLSPDYYNFERPPRIPAHPGDAYRSLLDQPPRKLVSIGPDFQADVPEWVPTGDNKKNCFSGGINEASHRPSQESVKTQVLNYEKELAGSVIIPMPEIEPCEVNGEVGVGRTDCSCGDVGSVRCVQQHILEARMELQKLLGPEIFGELGFWDMGEVVAGKWSGEEQQLFHEVVFFHPASLESNFWEHLVVEFPSRTMKEIVSYYFNVFMLRKRAEQNRCCPMNIDSDNDEWQGTDDTADNDVETDEDDDYAVESIVDPDRIENIDKDIHAYDEVASVPSSIDYRATGFGSTDINMLQKSAAEASLNCSISAKGSTGIPSHKTGGQDGPDESRTSNHVDTSLKATMDKSDSNKWMGHFSGTNGPPGHEFILEACNAREWDVGYLSRPRNDVDLLPTCSMIEEVFGAESWARDSRELS